MEPETAFLQNDHERERLIQQLRQSGIRLDTQGRFWHEAEEITHAGLRAALWRWVDRNPDGRYVLRLDAQRFVYLDVDDVPHLVRSLRWEGDRAWILLADGSEEELDYPSVHLRADGIVGCLVKSGRLGARFSPAAWAMFAERLEESDGRFRWTAAGQRFGLQEPSG